jgi:hypothetical protein
MIEKTAKQLAFQFSEMEQKKVTSCQEALQRLSHIFGTSGAETDTIVSENTIKLNVQNCLLHSLLPISCPNLCELCNSFLKYYLERYEITNIQSSSSSLKGIKQCQFNIQFNTRMIPAE